MIAEQQMRTAFQSIDQCIGNTPVIELNHPLLPKTKKLLLKLESFNPTFSIKDRTALGLIKQAFSTGKLQRGGLVIESTSGNLGKSLAMLGSAMGFKVMLVIDNKVSQSTINWCKAYGAEVIVVTKADKNGGYQQARIEKVKELLCQYKQAYWPNQYDNEANPEYHCAETAKELLQLDVDSVFGAVSTGGHMTGIAKGLRAYKNEIEIVACDVRGSAIFGEAFKPYLLNGVGLAWKCANIDLATFDKVCTISDVDAISTCHSLAKNSGVLLGGSGGLVVFAAISYLLQDHADKSLAIIADSGINYLNQIYDDHWLSNNKIELLNHSQLIHQLNQLSFKKIGDTCCGLNSVI